MTAGSISMQLQLGVATLPVALTLPDGTVQLSLTIPAPGLGLRQVAGWLLAQPDYRFPPIMGSSFLNEVHLRGLDLRAAPQPPRLALRGRLDDIVILREMQLTQAELAAEIRTDGVTICVYGTIRNPPAGWLHDQRLHFCFPTWQPKDAHERSPASPDLPPGPGLDPATLVALLSMLLGLGLGLGVILGGLLAVGWTLPELAAGLLAVGVTPPATATACLGVGASTSATLTALYQGLQAIEAVEAELTAMEATIEASYAVEQVPLEEVLGEVLPMLSETAPP